MVKSIKHWSIAAKVCDKDFKLTNFGKLLFSKNNSFDPYLEKIETLWLLHWMLSSGETLTTWYYVFNYHQSIKINKDTLINDLINGLYNVETANMIYKKNYHKNDIENMKINNISRILNNENTI